MKLAEFKLLTLEERLDYLFEHSVKDEKQRFQNECDKWSKCPHGKSLTDYCEPCGRIHSN